ncbi:MAG: hypothetical protein ACEQSF_04280, partial [Solirubrobacteraceae bacterium]
LSLKKLFSAQGNNILFFKEDLQFAKNIGKNIDILNSNNEINKLQEKLNKKGIKLILLICPDKYDVYYNYFIDKIKYPKPTFFDVYNKLSKKYIYIKSKELISQLAKNQKDVYYFDDTHWSPIAAKRIAKEINETINSTER